MPGRYFILILFVSQTETTKWSQHPTYYKVIIIMNKMNSHKNIILRCLVWSEKVLGSHIGYVYLSKVLSWTSICAQFPLSLFYYVFCRVICYRVKVGNRKKTEDSSANKYSLLKVEKVKWLLSFNNLTDRGYEGVNNTDYFTQIYKK